MACVWWWLIGNAPALSPFLTHDPALDDVDRAAAHHRKEARPQPRRQVNRHTIRDARRQDGLLDRVVAGQLGRVDDGVAAYVGADPRPQRARAAFSGGDGAIRAERGGVAARRAGGELAFGLHAHFDEVGRVGDGWHEETGGAGERVSVATIGTMKNFPLSFPLAPFLSPIASAPVVSPAATLTPNPSPAPVAAASARLTSSYRQTRNPPYSTCRCREGTTPFHRAAGPSSRAMVATVPTRPL